MAGADVEAEWTENRVYQALRTAALASGGDDDAGVERAYAVLRRRLIELHEAAETRGDVALQTDILQLYVEMAAARRLTLGG